MSEAELPQLTVLKAAFQYLDLMILPTEEKKSIARDLIQFARTREGWNDPIKDRPALYSAASNWIALRAETFNAQRALATCWKERGGQDVDCDKLFAEWEEEETAKRHWFTSE